MNAARPQRLVHVAGGASWPVLVWEAAEPVRAITSAPLGGGIGLRRWVLNAQVPSDYGRTDPDAHLAEIAAALGLRGGGVGLLTAADVGAVQCVTDGGAEVAATVGIGHPTQAAAPDLADPAPVAGTINVVGHVPERLSDAALVNAVLTITEAKAQAMRDLGYDATGTASDAVCLTCPDTGPVAPFGGPRSVWGARLARAVHAAVVAGDRPGR